MKGRVVNCLMNQLHIKEMEESAKIVVAMSGGVDSTAAAILLSQAGHEVVGISMQVWDYRQEGNRNKATCCAPADFDDAREAAEKEGFPYYVFDFEDSFQEAVIDPFVDNYLKGLTPNPCLECNRKVKFKELRRRAGTLGSSFVATGHYAQIKKKPDGALGLFTGKDRSKDQSYFLYALKSSELPKTLFPVGGMQKSEVRELLRQNGMMMAEKPESQDICFVGGTVSEFIEKRTPEKPVSGKIVSSSGDELGEHGGIHKFTVGQRRGVGLGNLEKSTNPSPLYVLDIDPDSNQVTVGDREELKKESFVVKDVNILNRAELLGENPVLVKLRYRHSGILSKVEMLDESSLRVTLLEGFTAVSPGQAAVFYSDSPDKEGDYEVYGGGTIVRDEFGLSRDSEGLSSSALTEGVSS